MPASSSASSISVGAARNVADLVSDAARRDPEHPALIESAGGRRLSWGQLDAAVHAEAARLSGHGLRPGERVVLRLPTSVSFCVSLFGVLRAGGVAVPVGPSASGRELERVLDGCAARLLVARPHRLRGPPPRHSRRCGCGAPCEARPRCSARSSPPSR